MKCPLRFISEELDVMKPPDTRFICLKGECAWWSSEADACAVMITAGNLAGLVAIGDTMLEKMPHDEQFRK